MDVQVTQFAAQVLAHVQDAAWALATRLCAGDAAPLTLNGRTYEIVRVLGEGGFAVVFLVRDAASGTLYALKKIRCAHGAESLRTALAEIDAMRRFRGRHVARLVDSCVVQAAPESSLGNVPAHDEEAGTAKLVYILMPYYARGSVQDMISAHALHGTRFDEREMLRIFLDVCDAVRAMHEYRGDGAPARPAMHARAYGESAAEPARGGAAPYAHRDLKPGNILLGDDGAAVLVDFGSTVPARIHVRTRREALAHQDLAAEHSSMPYRAPELFDVKTDAALDEQTDIWSLGCVLYAMAFLHSPFETPDTTAQGGSLALAITNGAYRMPDEYSEQTRALIAACLVDARARPTIAEVQRAARAALDSL